MRNYTLLPAIVKLLETFLELILWKPFQLFRRILNDVSRITKAPFLQCWYQSWEEVKISWSQVRWIWGMLQCCHIVLCYEILDKNRPICWSIVLKETTTAGSLFFGAFPSDRISKTTKDVNVHFFIHSSSYCKLHQPISLTFWSYCLQNYSWNFFRQPQIK